MNIMTARGADSNAYTGADMTAYYFRCGEGFYENLELLIKFVSTPYFTPEGVERERGIIAQEILMTEDDPGFVLYNTTMSALFDHHPVRESVAGTVESISHITAETLCDCHRAFYVPSNMALTVCGDVEPERVAELAARLLPAERRDAAVPDFGARESQEPLSGRVVSRMDIDEPMFIAAAKISTELPRGRDALTLCTAGSLAVRCLLAASGDFYSSLYAGGLLRGDFYRDVSPIAGTLLFECGGSSGDPERVFERLCETFDAAAATGIDGETLERARRAEYGAALRALGDPEEVCSSLASCHFGGYGMYEVFDALRAVTTDDCDGFVREYLKPGRLVLSTLLPGERI